MGDTKHTPGPWTRGWGNFVYRDDGSVNGGGLVFRNGGAVKDGRSLIATCVPLNGTAEELQTAFANAKLIAAAPDLLAALEDLMRLNRTQGVTSEEFEAACEAADEAINKAKGE